MLFMIHNFYNTES